MATPPPPIPSRAGSPPADGPPPANPAGDPDSPFARAVALRPEPKDGKYNPKLVKAVAEQLIDTWEAVSEYVPLPEPPPIEALVPPDYTGEGKLPEMLVGAFTLLLTAIAETAGPDGERYLVDVEALIDDMAVRKVEAQLKLLAKDKKVRKAVEAVMKAEGGDDETEEEEGDPTPKGPPPVPKGMAGAL